jgi:hypothetical protein
VLEQVEMTTELLDAGDIGVIRPGDTVLIGGPENLTEQTAEHIADHLRLRLPGVDFVVMSGCTVQGIYRGDKP